MNYQLDDQGRYTFEGPVDEATILTIAERIHEQRFYRLGAISSPADSQKFLAAKLAHLEHETFAAIFLDNRHQILTFERLFNGTIDGASVYPREVVKRALELNAAAVIFAHNHPSGIAEPSGADRRITRRLVDALALVDVRVLDHLVIGGTESVSFAERGLI